MIKKVNMCTVCQCNGGSDEFAHARQMKSPWLQPAVCQVMSVSSF